MMANFLLYFWVVFLPAMGWFWICNNRTASQRMTRLHAMPKGAGFYKEMSSFQRVSYDLHLWYLLTLRNPNRLYERSSE